MTDAAALMAEARARALAAGISAADMAWLDRLGWNPAAVAPVKSAADVADYERREKVLNAAVAALTFAERGQSPEGKMAAAFGAQLANWKDKANGDNDD